MITNGQARGVLQAGHDLLVTRARSVAFREADLVVVVGTPLDFRLGYGEFGGQDGAPPAQVVHVADAPDQIATHRPLAASAAGDLAAFFTELTRRGAAAARPPGRTGRQPRRPAPAWRESWLPRLQAARAESMAADGALLASGADPVHPLRIYGELARLLDEDAVVIGDGGDFVSYAGKYLEPKHPGGWLDPGRTDAWAPASATRSPPASRARPAQVVLLLGDGAAGSH